jgi:hypothetical protein
MSCDVNLLRRVDGLYQVCWLLTVDPDGSTYMLWAVCSECRPGEKFSCHVPCRSRAPAGHRTGVFGPSWLEPVRMRIVLALPFGFRAQGSDHKRIRTLHRWGPGAIEIVVSPNPISICVLHAWKSKPTAEEQKMLRTSNKKYRSNMMTSGMWCRGVW